MVLWKVINCQSVHRRCLDATDDNCFMICLLSAVMCQKKLETKYFFFINRISTYYISHFNVSKLYRRIKFITCVVSPLGLLYCSLGGFISRIYPFLHWIGFVTHIPLAIIGLLWFICLWIYTIFCFITMSRS
jgi:hypothetical protein